MNKKNFSKKKKFSETQKNLVGVKVQPIPRTKRERQIERIKDDLAHFNKQLRISTRTVIGKLGYDFNADYATEKETKLKDIVLKNEKHPQRFSIPMDPQIVQKFIAAPKYVVKSVDSLIKGERCEHIKTQHICMAVLEEGPVLFEFYQHLKYPYGKKSEENFNIGLFALLQGKDYFHITRYDSLSLQGHTQVFDDNGEVVMQFISNKGNEKQPHSHSYDQIFSVLFIGKDHVGHEDRVIEQKYASYLTAVRAWRKKLNVYELNKTFPEDMTIGEIYDRLKEFEESKKSNVCVEENGGQKWNYWEYQKKLKNPSESTK